MTILDLSKSSAFENLLLKCVSVKIVILLKYCLTLTVNNALLIIC